MGRGVIHIVNLNGIGGSVLVYWLDVEIRALWPLNFFGVCVFTISGKG